MKLFVLFAVLKFFVNCKCLLMSIFSGLKKNVVVVLRTITKSSAVQNLEKRLTGNSIIFDVFFCNKT